MKKIKILLIVLLIASILVSIPWHPAEDMPADPAPTPPRATAAPTLEPITAPPVVVTEYKSEASEAWLWDTISLYVPSDAIKAGIMGYYWRESFFRSDAVGGWAESLAYSGEDHCGIFTQDIDAGLLDGSTREEFIERGHSQYGGYGLGQWSSHEYLEAFYDFAEEWGTSIADAEMQIAFTVESMSRMEELWQELLATGNPNYAGWLIATRYDGTSTGQEAISQMAGVFYERWADNG